MHRERIDSPHRAHRLPPELGQHRDDEFELIATRRRQAASKVQARRGGAKADADEQLAHWLRLRSAEDDDGQ